MLGLTAVFLLSAVIVSWVLAARARRRDPAPAHSDVMWASVHHGVTVGLAAVVLAATVLPEEIFRRYPDQFDPKSSFIVGGVIAFVPLALLSLTASFVTAIRTAWLRRTLLAVIWVLSAALLLWLASPFIRS